LSFKRDRGKFVFVPPARWVYRKHPTPPQDVPKEKPAVADDLLKEARARIEVEEQKLAHIVEATILKAKTRNPDDTTAALDSLRTAVLQVWDHPDISVRTRDNLLQRLVTGAASAGRQGARARLERNEPARALQMRVCQTFRGGPPTTWGIP